MVRRERLKGSVRRFQTTISTDTNGCILERSKMVIYFPKRIVKASTHAAVLLLSGLVLISCAELESGVATFSDKVKDTFHVTKKATVTASRLNLRQKPSTQSRVLSVLRKGEKLEVFQLYGKWAEVKTSDEREGWVYTRYITGFEELFAEKQQTTEAQKSVSKPETRPAISSSKPPSALDEKRSGVGTPPDDRHAAGNQEPAADIKAAESEPSPTLKSHEETEGKTASIQMGERPIDQGGQFVFSEPEGLFSLKLPMGWHHRKGRQDYFEKYIFEDPTAAMGVWVVHTSSEDYSEDEFYRDLASLLMERSGGLTEISPLTPRKVGAGLEWSYGKVEIESEPSKIHEYWIKAYGMRLWAVVEVYPQTANEAAIENLSAIRRSFNKGTLVKK